MDVLVVGNYLVEKPQSSSPEERVAEEKMSQA
jgi:hypothetical protein